MNKQTNSTNNNIQSIVDMDDYLNNNNMKNKQDILNEYINILVNESINA